MSDGQTKQFICICCPLGCTLRVDLDNNGDVRDVSGYTCARGKAYAIQEATNPERMVTAVVCAQDSFEPLSVKTAHPVPKDTIERVLDCIHDIHVTSPVHAGDVLISNVADTGIDVIATKSVESDTIS